MMSHRPRRARIACRAAGMAVLALSAYSTSPAKPVIESVRSVVNSGKTGGATGGKPSPEIDVHSQSPGGFAAQPDPKRPGKYLWKIWANGFDLRAPSVTGAAVVQGTFTGVTAMLFQNGVASARLKAPIARGDNVRSAVVASGRITVTSMQEPGTWLSADSATWYALQNKVVASGHVHYVNGRTGMVIEAPVVVCDTVLRTIRSGKPGEMTIPLGRP